VAGSLDSGWVSTPLVSSGNSALVDSGAVDAADSVLLVCAPPLLPTVTPGAASVLEDVVPDVVVVSVAVVAVDVESAPVVAVDDAVPVVDVAAVPADDSPDDESPDDVELAELVEDDSEDVPVVSAPATP
jgi:hypothetical protein